MMQFWKISLKKIQVSKHKQVGIKKNGSEKIMKENLKNLHAQRKI